MRLWFKKFIQKTDDDYLMYGMLGGGMLLLIVLRMVSACVNGFVLSVLWGWFVVPIFHLPILPIIPAIGIFLTINLFTAGCKVHQDEYEPGRSSKNDLIHYSFLEPLFILFAGWIVRTAM